MKITTNPNQVILDFRGLKILNPKKIGIEIVDNTNNDEQISLIVKGFHSISINKKIYKEKRNYSLKYKIKLTIKTLNNIWRT